MKRTDWIEVAIIIYIVVASIFSFYINNLELLSLFFLMQGAIVLFITKSLRTLRPPAFLLLSFIVFYAIFQKSGESIKLGFLKIYKGGVEEGVIMSLRVYILIVLTSVLAHRRDRVIELLKRLRLPDVFILTLHSVLSMGDERMNFKGGIRDLLRGRTEGIVSEIKRRRQELEKVVKGDRRTVNDVSLLSSLLFFFMLTRYIRVAPGVPFSPGYKNVLIVPLYICASSLSSRRGAGLIFGSIAGILSLPFGNQYGIFGAIKEVIAGIISDLFPFEGGVILKAFKGGLVGLGRFSSFFLLALIAKVPDTYYAFLGIFALSNFAFGVLGGIISHYLVNALRTE